MNKTGKLWLSWMICTAVVVTLGFLRGWTTFHKIVLAVMAVLGVLQLVGPVLRRRMFRRFKSMSPEEQEKFLARFDQNTRARLRKQLESHET